MHYVHALVLSLFLYCFTALPSHAQNSLTHGHYDKNYFRSPLDIPLKLAGTFGELRTNHFHAGIDCKTGGQEKARTKTIKSDQGCCISY